MKLRQALKVRNRTVDGHEYRKPTLDRMRKRLASTGHSDDFDIWWHRLLSGFRERVPMQFAAFQFDCGMKLAAAKAERRALAQSAELR